MKPNDVVAIDTTLATSSRVLLSMGSSAACGLRLQKRWEVATNNLLFSPSASRASGSSCWQCAGMEFAVLAIPCDRMARDGQAVLRVS